MKICFVVFGAVLLAVTFGCAPRLAQTPLGNEEVRWQEQIKKSYPAWNPPQTVPPSEVPAAAAPKVVNEKIDIEMTEDVTVVKPDAAAVAPALPAEPGPALSNAKTYVVQKGDTLIKISRQMYNKSDEWQKIFDANRNILKSKDSLKPGMTLIIPAL